MLLEVGRVNTLAGSVEQPLELLHGYADLLAWSAHASVLTAAGDAPLPRGPNLGVT